MFDYFRKCSSNDGRLMHAMYTYTYLVRWPWPWCKVTVGRHMKQFSFELSRQPSASNTHYTCYNGKPFFLLLFFFFYMILTLKTFIWLDHLVLILFWRRWPCWFFFFNLPCITCTLGESYRRLWSARSMLMCVFLVTRVTSVELC